MRSAYRLTRKYPRLNTKPVQMRNDVSQYKTGGFTSAPWNSRMKSEATIPTGSALSVRFWLSWRSAALLALTGFCLVLASHALQAQNDTARKPVLVELFTSEGCSDCPPADDLLARLDRDQFAPGVHAIVLSEHVTYWNHLGWRDPFSMAQMDSRQEDYQSRFNLQSVYTPQMVVDGAEQFVGSNTGALNRALADAGSDPKESLVIKAANWNKESIQFEVNAPAGHLFAALAEDVTRSEVSKGENAGCTLHHVAVVRAFKQFKVNGAATGPLSLPLTGGVGASGSVRLVVFLTDAHTGHVLAVAESKLQRP